MPPEDGTDMFAKCPSCNTEYDCEPGRYRCVCGTEFTVEPDASTPSELDVTIRPRQTHSPQDGSGTPSDLDLTIRPRQTHSSQETADMTMPGRRERKPDGRFGAGSVILGRYKVLSELGQGGMGVVYKCFDETAGIIIALKALPPDLSHNSLEMEDVKENFQLVYNLHHPNIANYNTLEKDGSNGNYYLIMECVEGEDLRSWIRRKQRENALTPETVLPVIRQVAAALDYAHQEKVIHRDIKPGNVMINAEGHVKVLDFGLAAQIHTSMTRVSMAYQGTGGTALYMAPEQWRGKAQGAAADQYALAVMTYEMLAGRLPFENADVSVLREAVLNETPDPVESLPEYMQAAIERGMSKDPAKRFRTCSDFIAALEGKAVESAAPSAGIGISQRPKNDFNRYAVSGGGTAMLMKRISILEAQQDWDKAREVCDTGLNMDPENPELYLLMCMILRRIPNEEALRECGQNLSVDKNFQMALKFASPERKKQLESICQDTLVSFHLRKCLEANRVSDLTQLSRCGVPLNQDESFRAALQAASPERKKQLEQIQFDQADFFLEQFKTKYRIRELVQAPVPLELDELFRTALNNASPERREELRKAIREQCEYFLGKCMEANRVSAEADLAHTESPLAENDSFKTAFLCASPERKKELEKLQAEQVEFFLRRCMEANGVSDEAELSGCSSPLNDNRHFSLAVRYASPERREQLERLKAAQSDAFLRKCMETHHASDASGLVNCGDLLKDDLNFRLALACALPGQRNNLHKLASRQLARINRKKANRTAGILFILIASVVLIAFLWSNRLEIIATIGGADAKYRLAVRYDLGDGVEGDWAEALKWYRKAAEGGNANAQFYIGNCYERGRGERQDYAEAAEWYRKAAEQGHERAKAKLRIVELHRNAENGDAEAQYALGLRCENGDGVEKDLTEAAKWYRMAAEQGHVEAQCKLGYCYEQGNGVMQDYFEAAKWYRMAAEQKDPVAQFNLGTFYFNGYGVRIDRTEAVKWYRKAAEQKDPDAQYFLGICYENAYGVTKDLAEAAKWYRKAAEQGHAEAQFHLGECFELGKGVTKNYVEAVNWYRKAAEQGYAEARNKLKTKTAELLTNAQNGDPNAQYGLGLAYETGDGFPKDLSIAVGWYKKAADQGYAEAQYRLARAYETGEGVKQGKNLAEDVKWYQKAAEQGYAPAQFKIASAYETGNGKKKDLTESLNWYRKAAVQGHAEASGKLKTVELLLNAQNGKADAQYELARAYETGNGVKKDLAEAIEWYKKAAALNHVEAQYRLAQAYETGEGVKQGKNLAEAVKWYRKAAEQNHVSAQYKLALAYETGNGVKKDLAEAVKWYKKAAEKGNTEAQKKLKTTELLLNAQNGSAEAQYQLAQAYETGDGVPKDLAEAVKWYRKAADQGIADAQYKLALAYENGNGVKKDLTEAVKWSQKAAEQGIADAQYKLALAYQTGNGMKKNLSEAVKWYRKAANQGHTTARNELKTAELMLNAQNDNTEAQYKLALAYETGDGVPKDLAEALNWYRKAAEQGHAEAQKKLRVNELLLNAQKGDPQAQLELGKAYETGDGVPKDISEALNWYRKAAEGEHAEAQYYLGYCFEYGRGISQNFTDAVNCYRKAAEQGHPGAQYKLALALETGSGVTRDFAEAANWYRKAAEQGTAEAKEALERIGPVDISRGKTEATLKLSYTVFLKLIRVEAGTFEMSVADGGYLSYGGPHRATLTRDFYLAQTEVTQAQWKAVMGNNPSNFKGDDLPVEQVSWNDAMSFCGKLNSMGRAPNGWMFTLPTETQWEYAALGGNKSCGYKYSGSDNADNVAWYYENSGDRRLDESSWDVDKLGSNHCKTHPVGRKMANELGLYDMSGNVWEWCLDDWNNDSSKQWAEFTRDNDQGGSRRVSRGGCWFSDAGFCRSANRRGIDPGGRVGNLGFRVALVPAEGYGSGSEAAPANTTRQIPSLGQTSTASGGTEQRTHIPPGDRTINLPGNVKLELVKVEAGSFEMSARDGENRNNEVPHRATLTRDFYIGRTEVTQAQWSAVMGTDPSYFKGDDLPVDSVSWNEAMEFCWKLNNTGKAPSGWKFALPTETQWEYAARGGKKSKGYKYSGSNDFDEVAWYNDNSGSETHPVGQKKANELGVYDMSGNVYEWCLDDWRAKSNKLTAEFTRGNDPGGAKRVSRGGAWSRDAGGCRSAERGGDVPGSRHYNLGFRIVLVPESY